MRERPILFSGEMVRAILEGRKTQTRRAVNPQPIQGEGVCECPYGNFGWAYTVNGGACSCGGVTNRYGHPGDKLWVKETFCDVMKDCIQNHCFYRADMPIHIDAENTERGDNIDFADSDFKWTPSIFMPRWASRITLEIVSTRIERLQEITLDDARAEGVETTDQYAALWISINGAESWNSNPFVWVIEFKKLEGGAK